jgi:hypothetical protein
LASPSKRPFGGNSGAPVEMLLHDAVFKNVLMPCWSKILFYVVTEREKIQLASRDLREMPHGNALTSG